MSIIPRPRLASVMDNLEKDMSRALAEQRTQSPSPTITAEMALQQYKAAAGAIMLMAEAVQERISKTDASLADLHGTMKIVEDAANHIASQGEGVYARLEETRQLTEDIRNACAEFLKRVG